MTRKGVRTRGRLRAFAHILLLMAMVFGPAGSALTVFGQEITGNIQGEVKDQQGAVIPNATVTATGGQRSFKTTTNRDGLYRFNNLPPGVYSVSGTASGFTLAKSEEVTVEIGRTLNVVLEMKAAGAAESVTVTGASEPVVDVTSSKTSTNITEQQISALPKTLNFSSVINVAPGTREEGKSGGFQIDGASGSENTFIVDGVEVTRIQDGTLGSTKNIPFDFVKEVQVKSAGYEAEYGGATGGVINVVTKSGTNDYHGEVRLEYTSDALRAKDNPSLRLDPLDNTKIDYFTNPSGKTKERFYNPTFTLGGPIWKDKVWFFTSYAPQFDRLNQRMDLIDVGATAITTLNSRFVERKTKNDYFIGKLDYSPTSKLQVYGSFINSPVKTEGASVPFQTGSTTTFSDLRYQFKGGYTPAWQTAFGATYSLTDRLILSFRGGRTYLNDKGGSYDIPVNTPLVQVVFACAPPLHGCAPGTTFPGSPVIASNRVTVFDITKRTNLNFDATYITNLFGQQHVFKGGYQTNLLSNNINSGFSGGIFNFYFDKSFGGERGTAGYYRVTDFGTVGQASSKNQGFFVQDSWRVRSNITLNLGLRVENEFSPSFPINVAFHPTIPADANVVSDPIQFGWGDKIAPRIGGAWDVFGNGKLVVKGDFSIFYDTMKYELPRGSFGADHFLRTWYTLDQTDFRGIDLSHTPGTIIAGPVDFRVPSNVTLPGERAGVDPGLKPVKEREFTGQVDYALNNNMVVSARFTRKTLLRTIEDVGLADLQGNELFQIDNPGFGSSVTDFTAIGLPPTPKAKREYTGLELRLDKRFSNHWYAQLSYVLSKLYGNYSGLASSDENGRTSPNVNRYFDLPELVFDSHGNYSVGRLATDRPNTFKAFAGYDFSWWNRMRTLVGASQLVYQGIPISTELSEHVGSDGDLIYPEGRGDLGRTPVFTQTDLTLTHYIRISERVNFKFGFNVFNLWDERNVTNIFPALLLNGFVQYGNQDDPIPVAFPDFLNSNGDYLQRIKDQDLVLDPRYKKASSFQGGRSARISFGVTF